MSPRAVTFGATATEPSTQYGYIEAETGGSSADGAFPIARFVEKPDAARARAELVQLDRLASGTGPLGEEERARLIVQGAIAGAQYERDEMQLLLGAAHDLEVRLIAGDPSRAPVALAGEVEADFLRITDRYAAASERYRDVLAEHPDAAKAPDAMLRLGISLNSMGARDRACAVFGELDRKYPQASANVRQASEREQKRNKCT